MHDMCFRMITERRDVRDTCKYDQKFPQPSYGYRAWPVDRRARVCELRERFSLTLGNTCQSVSRISSHGTRVRTPVSSLRAATLPIGTRYVFALARTLFGPAIVAHDVIGNSVSTDNPKDTQDVARVTGHWRVDAAASIRFIAMHQKGGERQRERERERERGGGRGREGGRAPRSIKC